MRLANELLLKIADPDTNRNERARLRCRLAKSREEAGDYEGAREAMGRLWSRVGEDPKLDGLDQATAAEVLLRAGVLTGCIGDARQLEGAQETAKNLISESMATFETVGHLKKVAEAQMQLAYCYRRQGEYDEARILLLNARSRLTDNDTELKAFALLLSAITERATTRLNDALRYHLEAAPLFEKVDDHALKGKFHSEYGTVLKNLGTAEHRADYTDRALIEYAAASFHFQQAGHERFYARVENNLGMLFASIGKFDEAHTHLDRAQRTFTRLRDGGATAQVGDTRARVLLAEARNAEAERAARSAVQSLDKGGEQSLLSESLTTYGIALARTGQHVQALQTLQRAIAVAEQVGDRDGAGQASLAAIEELSGHFTPDELHDRYKRAAELLAGSQNPAITDRLLSCARQVMSLLRAQAVTDDNAGEFIAPASWEDFSLRDAIRRFERFLIELALREAGGTVSRAAQLLGFKHYQSLISVINHRHKDLMHVRSPVWRRRRSIIRKDLRPQSKGGKTARLTAVSHAGDNKALASVGKDSLKSEG